MYVSGYLYFCMPYNKKVKVQYALTYPNSLGLGCVHMIGKFG